MIDEANEIEEHIGLDKTEYQVNIFLFLNKNICSGSSLIAPL